MDVALASDALAALSHPDRLRAFRLLVRERDGMASGRVAEALGLPPTRTSFHLGALERAGLVSATRAGRERRYAVRPEAMRALLGFLTDDCCGGRPDMCLPLPAREVSR